MNISVIIPTYNAQSYLPALFEKLKEQTVPFELIVVDSSSTDATQEIAQQFADQLIVIQKNSFDHGGTRTLAAQKAHGEIVVFLTQDALPATPNTIEHLIEPFQDDTIAAVFGRQLPYEESSIFGKHLRLFNYPSTSYTRTFADKEQYGIKTVFFSDSFAAYKKEVLKEVGWFKDGLIVGEDMFIVAKILQAGYTLHYNANAEVYHSHSYTPAEEFKRYFDTGVFHAKESWLLDTFGKAEGEGKRYLLSELKFLHHNKAYHKLPEFFLRNLCKITGYKLGKNYRHIPKNIIPKLSMHKSWW